MSANRRNGMLGRSGRQPGKSISQQSRAKSRPGLIFALFGIFFAFGALFLAVFFGPAALDIIGAASWTEVDCQVTAASVKSHSGDDTTYSVALTYRYIVEGETYTGDRYKFLAGSSSGYDGKQRIVDRLLSEATTCWVDPEEPSQSVMERGWTTDFWFALIPLLFVLIGLGGLLFGFLGWRAKHQGGSLSQPGGVINSGLATAAPSATPQDWISASSRLGGATMVPASSSGRLELEVSMSPLGKLIALIIISLFWNGIVSAFVWHIYKEWRHAGSVEGCLALFIVPFVIIGLVMIVGIPYQLLALANPRPRLILDPAPLVVGGTTTLDWSLGGSSHRVRQLDIVLQGTETARYRRGTSTHTASEEFASLTLVTIKDRRSMASGRAAINVPIDTMHSFDGGSNKIKWTIEVKGDIRWWPDVLCSFPVDILPPRVGDQR